MRPAADAGAMEATTLLEAGGGRARGRLLREKGVEEEGDRRWQACAVQPGVGRSAAHGGKCGAAASGVRCDASRRRRAECGGGRGEGAWL